MRLMRFLSKICISIILIFSISVSAAYCMECIWVNKGSALAAYELTSLAVDKENPDTIYAGAKGFLFKTADGGKTWRNIFSVPGTDKPVNFILIHPTNANTIYIATGSGVFNSVDGGTEWRAIPLGVEGDNVFTVHIDTENKNVLFAGTESDIFISEDAGRNWARSSEGLSGINIRSIAQNYIDRKILFASAENGLFKSIDGGRKWAKIFSPDFSGEEQDFESEESEENGSPISPTWVSLDPFNPEIVYLSTKRGVYKSRDSGTSWTRLPNIGLANTVIKNVVLPSYNSGFIFSATKKGIFRFSEKEDMWREFYGGLTSKEPVFIALGAQEDALWLVAKKGVYKSKGDIYRIKKVPAGYKADVILQNFSGEPSFREIQKVAIEYAEVHPEKIAKWRRAAKNQALLPKLSVSVDRDNDKNLHWDAGSNPDTWVVGPEEESTGWDITCSWDLGDLIWNDAQTSIDVRSKLMVQLRDDILDEVTRLYFERRRLQIELLQSPPKDVGVLLERKLRLQELTADIDAMTGGYLSNEIEKRKGNLTAKR